MHVCAWVCLNGRVIPVQDLIDLTDLTDLIDMIDLELAIGRSL